MLSQTHPAKRLSIIGLAGGIGAGKSLAARILEEFGAVVIDFDRLSHEQLSDRSVKDTLRQWWGGGVFDPTGELDRTAIARIVFRDREQLARLEKLLYPRIWRRQDELMAAYAKAADTASIVLDAPKLFEANMHEQCHAVIFVDAEWAIRVQRVFESRGWTEEMLRQREKLLIPLDEKKAKSDHIVVNHMSTEVLRAQLREVYSAIGVSRS